MKRGHTSRTALASLAPALPARREEVRHALGQFRRHHGIDPTAYELLRWMQIENPTLDLNAVRPRLTELKDAGGVLTTGKRVCAVTEKRVYTWAAGPAVSQPVPRAPEASPLQEGLF